MRRLIQSYADAQASLQPAAKAVVMGNRQLTYFELFRWSNSLARALRSHGCRRGDRVGLLLSKTPLAIAGILGILKADCICLPLDVESPTPRLSRILDNAEPRLLLVDASGRRALHELRSHSMEIAAIKAASTEASITLPDRDSYVFCMDDIVQFPGDEVVYENGPDDPAYLLYTSGSTGVPKGVIVLHTSIAHFVDWAVSYFRPSPGDRISGHPPLHFDLSLFDIFGSFAVGAELHLVAPSLNLSAMKMAEFIRSSELAQWFSVPSVLNYMAKFDAVRPLGLPKLKRVLWCGEVLPTSTLRYWMERLPGAQFTNLYGPTEATIASSYYTVPVIPEPNESIPIGRPCDGEFLLVLDETLQPVPPDTLGQLYIGGVGLSPGYWGDEHKSRAAFITSPKADRRIYKTGDLAKISSNRPAVFRGTRRQSDQVSWISDRTRRNRSRAQSHRRPEGIGGRGDSSKGIRRIDDLLCLRARRKRGRDHHQSEGKASFHNSALHAARALAATGSPAEKYQWQDRSSSAENTFSEHAERTRQKDISHVESIEV
jgi:amino acid adenylation domain-containing protein